MVAANVLATSGGRAEIATLVRESLIVAAEIRLHLKHGNMPTYMRAAARIYERQARDWRIELRGSPP